MRLDCPSYLQCQNFYKNTPVQVMISREQLKLEIDSVDDTNIEVLHRIILALKTPTLTSSDSPKNYINPLKGSILFENDIISPIDVIWDAES